MSNIWNDHEGCPVTALAIQSRVDIRTPSQCWPYTAGLSNGYGSTKDRFGLVIVHGEPYQIVDIGMRMLTPRELANAQGFPADYIIEAPGPDAKPLTKTAQVRMIGNSVCPPLAEALVRANCGARAEEAPAA